MAFVKPVVMVAALSSCLITTALQCALSLERVWFKTTSLSLGHGNDNESNFNRLAEYVAE
jgi:hypothetical protein